MEIIVNKKEDKEFYNLYLSSFKNGEELECKKIANTKVFKKTRVSNNGKEYNQYGVSFLIPSKNIIVSSFLFESQFAVFDSLKINENFVLKAVEGNNGYCNVFLNKGKYSKPEVKEETPASAVIENIPEGPVAITSDANLDLYKKMYKEGMVELDTMVEFEGKSVRFSEVLKKLL